MVDTQAFTAGTAPAAWDLGAAYRSIAELLLNPEFRDEERIALNVARLGGTAIGERLDRFRQSPAAHDVGEYTQTLELSPPCPLYFGAYIYEEPSSCRGAGASGRNAYMIELAAIYAHFGVGLDDSELPDFVPVVVEFLAMSLDRPELDGIGLRRRLVEKYVEPGIAPLRRGLQKYESVYDLLLEALELAVNEDLDRLADAPVWLPPEVQETIPQHSGSPSLARPMEGSGRP